MAGNSHMVLQIYSINMWGRPELNICKSLWTIEKSAIVILMLSFLKILFQACYCDISILGLLNYILISINSSLCAQIAGKPGHWEWIMRANILVMGWNFSQLVMSEQAMKAGSPALLTRMLFKLGHASNFHW